MRRLLLIGILTIACMQLAAQRRLLVGGIAGISTSHLENASSGSGFNRGGGAYGGVQMDYQLTSRLSFNAQLQFQSDKYSALLANRFYNDVRFNAKRLLAGFTEYLPVGNHAGYMNLVFSLSHYTATGAENGSANRSNIFQAGDLRPWNVGGGLQLGYMFRFGLSIQTGFMFDFTRILNDDRFRRLGYQQFQLLQLGYMPGFGKRDRFDTWSRKKRRNR
jgi:hypothetical protein